MHNLTYNLQSSGEICLNTQFNAKNINTSLEVNKLFIKICNFLWLFGCKTPTDEAEKIRLMFAFSSVSGHNSNLEIRIWHQIMSNVKMC